MMDNILWLGLAVSVGCAVLAAVGWIAERLWNGGTMTGLRKLTEEWENDRVERQELTAADREELNALIDAERNAYWAAHCPAHGTVLDSLGGCAVCEQEWAAELEEERRWDL